MPRPSLVGTPVSLGSSSTTRSTAATVPADADVLVVFAHWENGSGQRPDDLQDVIWKPGGGNPDEVLTRLNFVENGQGAAGIFYKITPTPATGTIQMLSDASGDGVFSAACFSNVDTGNPFHGSGTTATGTSTTASVTVLAANNDSNSLIIGCAGDGVADASVTDGADQTRIGHAISGSGSTGITGVSSYENGTGSNVTHSYSSFGQSDGDWAILAVALRGTSGSTFSESVSLAASEVWSASGAAVMAPAIALPAAAGSVAAEALSALATLNFDAALATEVSPAGSDFNATITLPAGEALAGAAGIAFDKDVALAATATLDALGGLSLDDVVSLAAGLMLADAMTFTASANAVLGATAGATASGRLTASPSVTIGMVAGTAVSGPLIAEIAAALDALAGLGDAAQRETYAAIGLAAYGGAAEIDRLDASAALALGAAAASAALGRLEIAMAASLGGVVMIGATGILTGAVVPGTIVALDALMGSLDVTLEEATALGIGDKRVGGATVGDDAADPMTASDDAVTDVAMSDGA